MLKTLNIVHAVRQQLQWNSIFKINRNEPNDPKVPENMNYEIYQWHTRRSLAATKRPITATMMTIKKTFERRCSEGKKRISRTQLAGTVSLSPFMCNVMLQHCKCPLASASEKLYFQIDSGRKDAVPYHHTCQSAQAWMHHMYLLKTALLYEINSFFYFFANPKCILSPFKQTLKRRFVTGHAPGKISKVFIGE